MYFADSCPCSKVLERASPSKGVAVAESPLYPCLHRPVSRWGKQHSGHQSTRYSIHRLAGAAVPKTTRSSRSETRAGLAAGHPGDRWVETRLPVSRTRIAYKEIGESAGEYIWKQSPSPLAGGNAPLPASFPRPPANAKARSGLPQRWRWLVWVGEDRGRRTRGRMSCRELDPWGLTGRPQTAGKLAHILRLWRAPKRPISGRCRDCA